MLPSLQNRALKRQNANTEYGKIRLYQFYMLSAIDQRLSIFPSYAMSNLVYFEICNVYLYVIVLSTENTMLTTKLSVCCTIPFTYKGVEYHS